MRAVAVAAVVVYHFSPGLLPSGFLGVDVFMVVSGFIVTTGPFYHPGTMRLDLVDKTITYAPAGAWQPGLGYNIDVRTHLVSLQGCAAVAGVVSSASVSSPCRRPDGRRPARRA